MCWVVAPQRADFYRGIMGVVAEPFVLEQSEGRRWIIDPPVDDDPYGYVRKARAEVRAAGLMAQTTVTLDSDEEGDLAGFFGGLARDWKGWEGERRWLALEAEMAVEAWHDGRAHVMIAVTVKRPWLTYAQDAWSARVVFTLEAGEQLTAVARDLAFLLREPGRS